MSSILEKAKQILERQGATKQAELVGKTIERRDERRKASSSSSSPKTSTPSPIKPSPPSSTAGRDKVMGSIINIFPPGAQSKIREEQMKQSMKDSTPVKTNDSVSSSSGLSYRSVTPVTPTRTVVDPNTGMITEYYGSLKSSGSGITPIPEKKLDRTTASGITYGEPINKDKNVYYPAWGGKVEPRHAGGRELSADEYNEYINKELNKDFISQEKATDIKQSLFTSGQSFIDFDSSKPVYIEGVSYPGTDVEYKVSDFNPFLGSSVISSRLPSRVIEKGFGLFGDKEVTMSASRFDKYLENLGRYSIRESEKINPEMFLTSSDIANYQSNLLSAQRGISDWHKDVKVIEYDPFYYKVNPDTGKLISGKTEGVTSPGGKQFLYDIPFLGAEKYQSYKRQLKSDTGRATALGWGWGGLGNVDIAFYRLTGQEEKILERQAAQLGRYDFAEQQKKSGDLLGFSGTYWSGYLDSPATQIGLAYVGGYGIGKYTTTKSLVSAATTGKIGGSLVGKAVVTSLGVGFASYKTMDIVQSVQKGDIGEAIGKTWLFGTSVVAGVAGYQSGAVAGKIAAEPKIAKYFEQHPEQYRFYHYKVGERIDYAVEGKGAYRVGTPIERTSFQFKLTETYKPGKEIVASTKPYHVGLQEYSVGMGVKPNIGMDVTTGGVLQSKIKLSVMNIYKSVFDKSVNKNIERVTKWGVNIFKGGKPFGGLYKTFQIPKTSNIIIPSSSNVFFPVASFATPSTIVSSSLGVSTILSSYKYSPLKFGGMQVPKFEPVYKPRFDMIQTPVFEPVYKPRFDSVLKSDFIHVQTPKFDVGQTHALSQIQTPKFDYMYVPKFQPISQPSVQTPLFPTPPFFGLPIGGFSGGRGYRSPRFYSKGYRYRTWKVPTLESLLPGYKNNIKKWSM